MILHHLGWVGRDLGKMRRAFLAEGGILASEPIADSLQRVVVQFVREAQTDLLWELVAPLADAEDSPLGSRLGRGGGFDHVCYELEPGDGTLEDCLSNEGRQRSRIICAPVMATAFGRRIAFVYRRSGRIIELVEPRAGLPL